MNLKLVVIIAIGLASASQANAQRADAIGVSRQPAREDSTSQRPAATNAGNLTFRFIASAGVATAAAVGLGLVGGNAGGSCSCDDPGLEGAIGGILAGIVVGAPLGAAAPSYGSPCTFNRRFGRSLVGSLAGTALGILTLAASQSQLGVLAVPAFAVTGSVLSLGPCLNSRGG